MEREISKLLTEFEDGKMTRRDFIRGVGAVAMAAAGVSGAGGAAAQATGKPFKAYALDHIAYEVADYARTRDFYVNLLGMTVSGDTGKQCYLDFGNQGSVLLARTATKGTVPRVDHVSYYIEDWNTDKVQAEFERRGLKAWGDKGWVVDIGGGRRNYASFHVVDPDGYNLQIGGWAKPGDRVYKA
jgi:catechol 2,3-dioxygenase